MFNKRKTLSYNPGAIEKKWQKIWEKSGVYKVKDSIKGKDPSFAKGFGGRRNFYHLVMFPYPSGDLHIGHWYNFAPADVYARLKKMQGYNVLSPIGFDAFGLPAENAAIQRKIHPRAWTMKNIATMRKQLKSMGNIYDFSREVITSEPDYYKWTQWMFLQMYKAGLAYKKKVFANWCPKDQTVLANEQVVDGRCERHPDTLVIQKEVEQWMFKITDYAEELLDGLEKIDWPERTKIMQRNWIGKSEGAIVKFSIFNSQFSKKSQDINPKLSIEVFTTRPDTLFGATYIVLAPEHPLVEQITTQQQKDEVRHYVTNAHLKTELERTSLSPSGRSPEGGESEKTGIWTGAYAVNPVNEEKIPVWISDYVLLSYGTGAIMAVPAHDDRDWEFAKKFNLPIRKVIDPGRAWPARNASRSEAGGPEDKAWTEGGLMVNSGEFTGLESQEGRKKITEWLKSKGLADFSTQYKMRDWIISRQRYWGAPIPIIYCKKCGVVSVSEKDLPVKLPLLKNFRPVAGGKSPLARVKSFVNTKCPKCKGKATRETDTMDTFVDSSWYYLAYIMRGISKFLSLRETPRRRAISKYRKAINAWLPVNMYIGGAEHSVMHLLYSRFFTKVLRDANLVDFDEPFMALRHQGIILGPDGQKMSKSRGNVIDPDDLVRKYGVDTVRMYLCFMGEYAQGGPWNPTGILGIKRFLDRIWNKFQNTNHKLQTNPKTQNTNIERLLNQTIKKVGDDIQNFRFNTAVSALMILFNAMEKEKTIAHDTIETFLKLLSPLAPYFTEELWSKIGNKKSTPLEKSRRKRLKSSLEARRSLTGSIHLESWPKYNIKLIEMGEYDLVIQINGKTRDKVRIPREMEKPEIEKIVLQREQVKKYLGEKQPKKIIFVEGRLINIVV